MNTDGTSGEQATQDAEVYRLWATGAPERHERLDALFRERLFAYDGAGCQALLDAVATAGGADDPLLHLCRGLLASEITRDWGAAETHFQAVLRVPGLAPSLRARALQRLGVLAFYQGRFAESLLHLDESCRVAEAAGDQRTLANALMSRGITCSEGWVQGQLPRSALDEALACHQRSRDIFQQLAETNLELFAWNNLGITYKQMGRFEDALGCYHAALRLALPTQHHVRAKLANNIAEVEEAHGNWAQALDAYGRALAIYREIGDDYQIADALLNLGIAQEQRGLADAAMESYREAVAATESLRARLLAEETRAGFLGTRLAPYERMVRLSLAQPGGVATAFEMIERAKARAFIELLAEHPLRPPQAVPPELLERERGLRAALAHLYQMGAGRGTGSPIDEQATALEATLADVYRQMRRLDAQYAGCRSVDPLSLREAQERLPSGAALLEYFAVDGELGCLVISSSSAVARMLPEAATRLRQRLEAARSASGLRPPHVWTDADGSLYAALLAPLDDLITGHDDLYIIPHDLLHYVPLHALGRAETPLVARHRVTYAPSASILLGGDAAKRTAESEHAPGCLALGYGDDLRYAGLEAYHVAALTGGRAYVGAEASATALRREGPRYRLLHLACHGVFNAQAPLASGLLLADGKLDAMVIMQELRLRADLIVLSACDTGQAAVLRGDELTGLARAFLYAGAREVLVSLWPVDDLATALLVNRFYQEYALLPSGPGAAAGALRRAQLALRSMSIETARSARERLRAALPAEALTVWADAAGASRHATSGDGGSRQRLAAPTPPEVVAAEAQGGRAAAPAERGAAHERRPYADPYYWAAFTLVSGPIDVQAQ